MTGFLGGANGKESIYQCRRHSVPGLGRSPGEGNDNPLQYSCLENPMDRGAWQATVHGVIKELDTAERLNSKQQQQQNFSRGNKIQ